jgi:hypothetical protein
MWSMCSSTSYTVQIHVELSWLLFQTFCSALALQVGQWQDCRCRHMQGQGVLVSGMPLERRRYLDVDVAAAWPSYTWSRCVTP